MNDFAVLLTILAPLLVGAMSPGPSFLLVARTAAAQGRTPAVGSALGMGTGAAVFAILAVAGLQTVLLALPWLYDALRILGAMYLFFIAARIWKSAASPTLVGASHGQPASFSAGLWSGLLLQLSNPKTALVHAGVYGALLPAHASAWLLASIPPSVCALELAWYGMVAFCLSEDRARRLYLSGKTAIDRVASVALVALGSRLIWDFARDDR